MNKKTFIACVCALALLFPASVSAHVLIKDQAGATGAMLHVNPDDDPIAGEHASLFFDIRDGSISSESSKVRLTITDDTNVVAAVPSELRGTSVSAQYAFPRQGIYQIALVITQGEKTTHMFLHSQRVGRGIMGNMHAVTHAPWAEAGIIMSVIAAAGVAIIAFNRRKAINSYSKM